VMKYIKANWGGHDVALVGQCMGANSIFKAYTVAPEAFDGVNVKCFAALQPTRSTQMRGRMTKLKLGVDVSQEAGKLQEEKFGFPGVDCVLHAPDVKVPVLVAQMKKDVYINNLSGEATENDAQSIFDAIKTEKKLLFFGPETNHPFGNGLRFEGYSFYNYHPEPLIEFLNSYMGGPSPTKPVTMEKKRVKMEKDEDHANCQGCNVAFGFPRPRRHHCRVCGKVLCSSCASKQVGRERACLPCWTAAEVEKMNNTGEATDTKFETCVEIDAPASVVWGLFKDGKNISSWSTSLQSIEGELKEGGQVTVNFKALGLDFSVPHTVRNYEEGVQWSWSDEIDHGITNNHLYRFEAIDATHTRFINNDELTGGDPVLRYSVLRDMKLSYEELNEQVKNEAEKRYAESSGGYSK